MSIHNLKNKKKKITQHLNNMRDRKVSKSHMDEQKLAITTINKQIRAMKQEREKKNANR